MGGILLYPLLYAFYRTFTTWTLIDPSSEFIGLGNYINVVGNAGFQQSLANQLIFVFVGLTVQVVLGLIIAVALDTNLRGVGFWRGLLFIPPTVVPAVVGFSFRFMMQEEHGIINRVLGFMGIADIPWLYSPEWVLPAVVIVDIWQFTPLMVLLFLAGLKGIPFDVKEAGRIDGANAWGLFRHIVFPLLRPVFVVALTIRIIEAFRTFDTVTIMTGGGPGYASELLTVTAYRFAFSGANFGEGAAVSFIALVLTLLCLGILYLLTRRLGRLE